jgi:hypothetical protein
MQLQKEPQVVSEPQRGHITIKIQNAPNQVVARSLDASQARVLLAPQPIYLSNSQAVGQVNQIRIINSATPSNQVHMSQLQRSSHQIYQVAPQPVPYPVHYPAQYAPPHGVMVQQGSVMRSSQHQVIMGYHGPHGLSPSNQRVSY